MNTSTRLETQNSKFKQAAQKPITPGNGQEEWDYQNNLSAFVPQLYSIISLLSPVT